MWRFLLLVLGSVGSVAGCGSSTFSDAEAFGRFEGDVVAYWGDNGRDMTLKETFTYIDSTDRPWVAPAGSVVDGASIPSAFWSVIGSPFAGKYRNASVVHDVECDEMRAPWEDVHRMFYEACRCAGVDATQAKIMFYAVHHFGPRWEPIEELVVEPRDIGNGQVVMQEVVHKRMARLDPPPPTAEEMEQVEAYVRDENPRPESIQRLGRDELRRRGRRTGGRPSGRTRPGSQRNDRSQAGPQALGSANDSAIAPDEQEYVIDLVRQHIQRQTGESRPARYSVAPTRGAYRVYVQFVQQDEHGEVVSDAGGTSTALVSRQGQILEFINGS